MRASDVTNGNPAESMLREREAPASAWIRPKVLRLYAGEAENFAGASPDGGINPS
jgi:hypothetical protein